MFLSSYKLIPTTININTLNWRLMKIVILDRKTLGNDVSTDIFKNFGELTIYETSNETQTLQRVKDAHIVITNKAIISKEIMEKSNIKLICIAATGMNNVDLDYAKIKNIEVKNVAGYSSNSVAQVAFSIIFKFIINLDYYKNYCDNGNWEKSDIFTNIDEPFHELASKRVGVIGLGDIGKSFAKIASSFESEVVYYSTSGKNNNSEYKQVSLEELLSTCDIISINSPLNDKTKNLINYDNLKLLKEKTILLNLARGGIINEEALAKILDEKEIYAGIDVATVEPIKVNNPLRAIKHKERLILTPHIGWASIEARKRLIKGVASNIKEFLK